MMKREPKQSTEATGPLTIEFLSAIIDHIAHPIFVKDREFRFVLLNRALGAMVGHSVPDMLGKTDYDFFPKAEADFFREKDMEMFRSGSTVVIEEEPITTASGESRILATTKVPRRDRDGQVTHLIGIIKDITDLKRAEGALREANRNLELRVTERTAKLEAAQEQLVRKERLAVLGHLAGGLAHQLRNPLGAIQNATALLARGPLDQVQHDARRVITEEVRRAD
ncbi:MAG: PAS domain S-box protein, partial [Polyangiaceae bacterium]